MAFFKGSYYETLPAFDPPESGTAKAFRGIRSRPIPAPEPVLEHGVSRGDRLDALAQEYYANPRDWRRLADCNPGTLFAEDLIYDPDFDGQSTGVDEVIEQAQSPDRPRELQGANLLVPRRREGR